MVVASQYQLSAFVKRNRLARLGTFAIAMTSLKDTICTAVTIAIMYMCPMNIAPKNVAIMTSVHIVRVMKVAFFFSYSDGTTGAYKDKSARLFISPSIGSLTAFDPSPPAPGMAGDPGSEAPSLMSEKLLLRPSALELCPFR